jgi:NDP-sugar pyrophosphorylase family protein
MKQDLNILIPMAGDGSRFFQRGYKDPKPFIKVHGSRLIDIVLDNITPKTRTAKIVLVTKLEHNATEKISGGDYTFVELETKSGGALDTILRAVGELDLDKPLLLANCDQLIRFDVDDFIKLRPGQDGSLVTFTSCNPHHSYVTLSNNNYISEKIQFQFLLKIRT